MRIRPTALGWKGLLLLAALECAFLATSYSNLFFLLIAFCVAVGALAAVWTARNLRGVRIERLDVAMAAADRPHDVVCAVHAARPRCDLRFELVEGATVTPFAQAPCISGRLAIAGALPPRRRGIARVHAVRVSSHFPLGLFTARIDVPLPTDVVTHPAPQTATAAEVGGAEGSGPWPMARAATVQELRPFRAGDALADVHWKATARRGQPVVKERDRDGDRSLVFVLDRRCEAAALERALGMLAGATLDVRHDPVCVRILSQDGDLTRERSGSGGDAILRWLAAVTPLPASAPPPPTAIGALRLPARSPAEARA